MFNVHFIRALVKAAIIVVPILGCTWAIGLFAVNENTAAFAWIFTIVNSLQVLYLLAQIYVVYKIIY